MRRRRRRRKIVKGREGNQGIKEDRKGMQRGNGPCGFNLTWVDWLIRAGRLGR